MKIEKVGVAGLGKTASIVLQAIAGGGFPVVAWDGDEAALERDKNALSDALDKAVDSGTLTKEEKDDLLARITFTADMDRLNEADLVVESAMEDITLKKRIFSELSDIMPEAAILATNTSCFSVTEIAQSVKKPHRVIGLHFFGPPQGVTFVEVVSAERSSEETVSAAVDFCAKIGKETVVAKDSPGLIANYLFVAYMNQALDAYDHGLADKEDLDTTIRMGLGYPKGPLELIDHIGLDEYLHLTTALYERSGDLRFAPPVILTRMADSGKLGEKTGEGFYAYNK